MNKEPETNKALKETLFERIECEGVCPKSRLFFHSRECFVWFVWFVSVLVGALAIAVSTFVVVHHQYALYEATHDNFLTFLVQYMPYIWIMVFALMVFVAVFNLKHTKHGYRYPVWMILASSVVLSFAGGSALHLFGFGYQVDRILGENMAMYMSQGKIEHRMWQDSNDGRLLGMQVYSTDAPTSTIIFQDMNGKRWQLNVSELDNRELQLLASEQKVKLLGKTTNHEFSTFHACGAFPWMLDKNNSMKDMDAERRAFVDRVYNHTHSAEEKLILLEGETYAAVKLPKESVCADIAAVRRMRAMHY